MAQRFATSAILNQRFCGSSTALSPLVSSRKTDNAGEQSSPARDPLLNEAVTAQAVFDKRGRDSEAFGQVLQQ